MTLQEFRKSISSSAKNMLKKHGIRYADIKIFHSYQMAYIDGCNGVYFQGDSFDSLMDESIKPASEKTGLSEKTCLLWFLESAGVL
jgi:hypothetical protein